MIIRDYDSYQYLFEAPTRLEELYSGQEVVAWQGRIERQLIKHIEEYEAARNPGYADKLRSYLQIWRQHQLTGSLNIETIDALSAATEVLGVDPWKLQTYFSNLRDNLRRLKASVEELPLDVQSSGGDEGMGPPMGGGGGMGGEPPPAPGEGAAEEPPGEENQGKEPGNPPQIPGEAPPGAPRVPNPGEEEQPPA